MSEETIVDGLTVRDALKVTGDVRAGVVSFNLHAGKLELTLEEGQRDEGEFLPTRVLGTVAVTGEDYRKFLDAAKSLRVFLNETVERTLSQKVEAQAQ